MASTTPPATMKSLLQVSREIQEVALTTLPVPTPKHPQDVLVKVHAASPCKGELTWVVNFPDSVPQDKILIPCQDLAGTVVTAPADKSFSFVPGDRVYCRIEANRPGTGCEYALPRASELAKIPPSVSWIDAAATPLSALTAWEALFIQGTLDAAGLKGDAEARAQNAKIRVLVTGAAGAVGSWAVQLAALAGAKGVVAVSSGDTEEAVRKLGATEVVDYRKVSVEDWVKVDPAAREIDLVIDMVGGKTLAGCWTALREGGSIISINTPPDVVKPAGLQKNVAKSLFFVVEPLGKNLEQIGELLEAGKVRPGVDSVFEFADFKKAFERLESGKTKGKVIIKISDEA